jgi:hypothetical protein
MAVGKTYDHLHERPARWIADQRIFLVATAPTVAHLRDNGRIVLPGEEQWAELAARFPAHRSVRAVAVVEVQRIADSCGYVVPLYQYARERDLLDRLTDRKDDAAIAAYRAQHNNASIDDLPALPMATGDRQAGSGWGPKVAGGSLTSGPPQTEGHRKGADDVP